MPPSHVPSHVRIIPPIYFRITYLSTPSIEIGTGFNTIAGLGQFQITLPEVQRAANLALISNRSFTLFESPTLPTIWQTVYYSFILPLGCGLLCGLSFGIFKLSQRYFRLS